MEDLYGILGVERTASPEEIKAAYRRAAMDHHPDRNIGDEETANQKFQAVQSAYETLSDPDKRAFYDQNGTIPSAPVDPDAAFREDAIQIFMEAVANAGPQPTQRDIVDLMLQIVTGKQMTLRQAIQQNESMIAKLEKMVPRIGRKEGATGPNILSSFIEADIAGKRQQNERTRQMLEHGEKLLEYIRTYTFDVEPAVQTTQFVIWPGSHTASTASFPG